MKRRIEKENSKKSFSSFAPSLLDIPLQSIPEFLPDFSLLLPPFPFPNPKLNINALFKTLLYSTYTKKESQEKQKKRKGEKAKAAAFFRGIFVTFCAIFPIRAATFSPLISSTFVFPHNIFFTLLFLRGIGWFSGAADEHRPSAETEKTGRHIWK